VSDEPDPILEHLMVGWQKVLDGGQYGDTIYVFRSQTPLGYSAAMHETKVIGPVIRTLRRAVKL
jgi:hypothetical protein